MMGPYYTYFDHDCMWSGECCHTVIQLVRSPELPPKSLEQTRPPVELEQPIQTVELEQTRQQVELEQPRQSIAPELPRPPVILEQPPRRPVKLEHQRQSVVVEPQQQQQQSRQSGTRHSRTSNENKKLRHREVEKNRHRHLQAMVKELGERIPGRRDKETQVQIMKRAARYCVYLRDTINALHGQQKKLDLEKIYLRSCDNVESTIARDRHV